MFQLKNRLKIRDPSPPPLPRPAAAREGRAARRHTPATGRTRYRPRELPPRRALTHRPRPAAWARPPSRARPGRQEVAPPPPRSPRPGGGARPSRPPRSHSPEPAPPAPALPTWVASHSSPAGGSAACCRCRSAETPGLCGSLPCPRRHGRPGSGAGQGGGAAGGGGRGGRGVGGGSSLALRGRCCCLTAQGGDAAAAAAPAAARARSTPGWRT